MAQIPEILKEIFFSTSPDLVSNRPVQVLIGRGGNRKKSLGLQLGNVPHMDHKAQRRTK